MLRGGEFLYDPSSDRPLLLLSHVSISTVNVKAVRICIPQPKARWWLTHSEALVFAAAGGCLCPVRWWLASVAARPDRQLAAAPAFVRHDGAPLTKRWMIAHTQSLLAIAGVPVVDALDRPTSVVAASWRAGGVRAAVDAGVAIPTIMAMGRWSSDAWQAYLQTSPEDLRVAVRKMWDSAGI